MPARERLRSKTQARQVPGASTTTAAAWVHNLDPNNSTAQHTQHQRELEGPAARKNMWHGWLVAPTARLLYGARQVVSAGRSTGGGGTWPSCQPPAHRTSRPPHHHPNLHCSSSISNNNVGCATAAPATVIVIKSRYFASPVPSVCGTACAGNDQNDQMIKGEVEGQAPCQAESTSPPHTSHCPAGLHPHLTQKKMLFGTTPASHAPGCWKQHCLGHPCDGTQHTRGTAQRAQGHQM